MAADMLPTHASGGVTAFGKSWLADIPRAQAKIGVVIQGRKERLVTKISVIETRAMIPYAVLLSWISSS